MARGKKFVIAVGRTRIESGISGELNKQTELPIKQTEVMIPVGGYAIPTRTVAWGRRVIDGKPRANKNTISPTDMDYKGEVEFMKWGAQGGEQIVIQYLPTSNSLDRVYQEKRLNLTPSDEDSSIMLEQGIKHKLNVFCK